MADVRLTATNPEDSSVVPVACDASGRLLLEERGEGPQGPPGPKGDDGQDGQDGKDGDPFSGNFADNVTFGGSAEFAGSVETSGNILGTLGLSVNRGGTLTGAGNECIKVYPSPGGNSAAATFTVSQDGSGTFAGGKAGFTEEGYLWCTTERGDTVMLQATVGGAGMWVEYTPKSRIDEIRDKLDAKRPDTGEMPADTP